MHSKFFLFILSAVLPTVVLGQDSCTAVATIGQASGNTCESLELGDAKQNGPGFGNCEPVTNAACVWTESFEGACAIHLYSDNGCNIPITGGNIIMCGEPPMNVDFQSFQIEC